MPQTNQQFADIISRLKLNDLKMIIEPSTYYPGQVKIEVMESGEKKKERKSCAQLLPDNHMSIATVFGCINYCIDKLQ